MSKKTDYFGELNSATLLRFGLDSQIYDTDIATPLGLTKTSPAGSKDVVPASLKVGFATGKFIKLKARCERGAPGFEKTRIVPLICEVAKPTKVSENVINCNTCGHIIDLTTNKEKVHTFKKYHNVFFKV
jgi:hypothetical protein